MILGVPTIVRYDLLQLLLDSAEAGSERPSLYVIVDNGGELRDRVRLPANTEVISPGRNLGVAASWNLLLERADPEPVVISNDDVILPPTAFEQMARAVREAPFVTAGGQHLFAQAPECTRTVGWYDEAFWPAYFEDTDYDYRRQLTGVPAVVMDLPGLVHEVSASLKVDGRFGRGRSGEYYSVKWGGMPGREKYRTPFDGRLPLNWAERPTPWTPSAIPRRTRVVEWIYSPRRV